MSREKENPGGVLDGAQNTVPAGAHDEVPAEGSSVPTVPPGASDLLVIGGVAWTREAILAAHRPDAAGKSCRSCGYVYDGVRACPAAAEALEECSSLVAPAPAGPVEIVHMVCGPRPRRSPGLRGRLLPAIAVLALGGQEMVTFAPLHLPRWVHLAAALAVPVTCLAVVVVAVLRTRRGRAVRRGGDGLEPLV